MHGGSTKHGGKVLVIASQKGGVGKTTLALNASYAFALRGWKTLLIDADPQGSIGCSIAGHLRDSIGLADVLAGSEELDAAVVASRLADFKILPVGKMSATAIAGWSQAHEDGRLLGQLFTAARAQYDLIVVDTPPAISGATLGALRAADFVVVPLQAEPLAARSAGVLLEMLASLGESGTAARLAGLVLTMLQSRHEASLGVAQESWQLFPDGLVLEASVPRDGTFLEASAEGAPLALLRRRPPAVAAVFDQIAAELESRLELEVDDGQDRPIPLLG